MEFVFGVGSACRLCAESIWVLCLWGKADWEVFGVPAGLIYRFLNVLRAGDPAGLSTRRWYSARIGLTRSKRPTDASHTI